MKFEKPIKGHKLVDSSVILQPKRISFSLQHLVGMTKTFIGHKPWQMQAVFTPQNFLFVCGEL